MRFSRVAIACIACAAGACALAPVAAQPPRFDVVIRNGRIVDGTGAPWFRGDVAIKGDRIAAVGVVGDATAPSVDAAEPGGGARLHRSARPVRVQRARRRSRRQQDNARRHDRGDRRRIVDRAGERAADQEAAPKAKTLRCRAGLAHAGRVLRAARAAFAHRDQHRRPSSARAACATTSSARASAGHAGRAAADEAARRGGDGAGRAGAQHLAAVRARSLRDTEEIVELAKVAARHGGVYFTHQRSEGARIFESLDEVFAIAERAQHPRRNLASEDRVQGELGQDAGGAAPHRGGARARPRRHGEQLSLHARVERPRFVHAALGARGRLRRRSSG